MKRREFITILGGTAAATWPVAAPAQQRTTPLVGYLGASTPDANFLAAFRKGLSEIGYDEGRNLTIEYRFANNQNDRLPELAAELVRRQVAVIAASVTQAAVAAKVVTATIPIVFRMGEDPVLIGLVASLNRPGGNVTGITNMNAEIGAKRLGLLHELIPSAERYAALVNPTSPNAETSTKEAQSAAATLGRPIEVLTASTNRDIDAAFANAVQKRADALWVSASSLFASRRVQLVTLAAHYRLPTIYWLREFAEAGGLMTYGASATDEFRQVGVYTGRILKGEKPADLPVMRASKFEFVINLQTAKTLGITIPATLLAIADEVIE
jgi:putative tryptophan/tyrosine transport system substrate-binding protein